MSPDKWNDSCTSKKVKWPMVYGLMGLNFACLWNKVCCEFKSLKSSKLEKLRNILIYDKMLRWISKNE